MTFDLRPCTRQVVEALVKEYHGYAAMGNSATYAFAVYEHEKPVAAYVWLPPPPQSAKTVCPEAPFGVLSLSRMVAVPRAQRDLKHVSKPLMRQMKNLIDRGRWPVLVTYSDEGQGHTGYVYQCSGWEKTARNRAETYTDCDGARRSAYSNGTKSTFQLQRGNPTFIQRWEHWICDRGSAYIHMQGAGWERFAIPGKVWKSGRQAYGFRRTAA